MSLNLNRSSRKCIGILRETKNKWERRAALAPEQVAKLVQKGVTVLVQPSDRRIFTDQEYSNAGAIITEDVSSANTLFGVKEFAKESLLPNKTYVLFAHVIKAQPYSMPFLDECLAKNVRLVDYECIRAPSSEGGQRLVAFGRFAGLAGMIDTFRGVGERLLSKGFSTPFMGVSSSYSYANLEFAKRAIHEMGQEIARVGVPPKLNPLTFVFTGNGNVAQGSREIFDLVPHQMVSADELPELIANPHKVGNKLIGCVAEVHDLVAPISPGARFNKSDYYQNPQNYRPIFHEKVAPYTSVLVNGMYWDRRYPRLLTVDQYKRMAIKVPSGLIMVGDITCDIDGSVEFLAHNSSIDKPYFIYDVNNRTTTYDLEKDGVMMLGVDNLPTEFPREATQHFSTALFPFVESLAVAEGEVEMPVQMAKATITSRGSLTPDFQYIQKLRAVQEEKEKHASVLPTAEKIHRVALKMEGHLFDSGLINKALDLIEHSKAEFEILHVDVGVDKEKMSSGAIQISADTKAQVQSLVKQIHDLAKFLPTAEATITELPFAALEATRAASGKKPATFKPTKTVLVLGAGYVAGPLVEYLTRPGTTKVVVASSSAPEAHQLVQRYQKQGRSHLQAVTLDASNKDQLDSYVRDCDVVVSLLPAPMHPGVAELCIKHKKHLVTASYISPAMKGFDSAASAAGLVFLNEVGLDPGIDHMSSMPIIHDVVSKGGKMVSFESYCGGLPAPEAADNPLGYKFSWNPRGVLTASQNDAKYRSDGKVIDIKGSQLLASAKPFYMNPAFALEHLPNRNSLSYADLYGIPDVRTMYRGTLRYRGFSSIMNCFAQMGLLNTDARSADLTRGSPNWHDMMLALLKQSSNRGGSVEAAMGHSLASSSSEDVDRAVNAANWLGITSKHERVVESPSVMDAFCALLQKKLAYKAGERDMVIMHHTFGIDWGNGSTETKTATMVTYGNERGSAMGLTVGIPAAISTQLILEGRIGRAGVLAPMSEDIYRPVLDALKLEGIELKEESSSQ